MCENKLYSTQDNSRHTMKIRFPYESDGCVYIGFTTQETKNTINMG